MFSDKINSPQSPILSLKTETKPIRKQADQPCSDACRAAASRKRREREHQDALVEARTQLALEVRDPDKTAAHEAARMMRASAASVRDGKRPMVTHAVNDLIAADREQTAAMDMATATDRVAPTMNRAEQRRAERRKITMTKRYARLTAWLVSGRRLCSPAIPDDCF